MPGETNLTKILEKLAPQLNEGEFVFVAVKNDEVDQIKRSSVLGEFKEEEGTTLIVKRQVADQQDLLYEGTYAWITLKVHSSLEAVGLTATFASALAEQNISCNVVAGYYHDHVFVNKEDELQAVQVLEGLSQDRR